MTFRLLAILSLLIPTTLVSAQSERVTVRMAPAPNQTLHLRTTQDMAMTTETGGDGSAPFPATAGSGVHAPPAREVVNSRT